MKQKRPKMGSGVKFRYSCNCFCFHSGTYIQSLYSSFWDKSTFKKIQSTISKKSYLYLIFFRYTHSWLNIRKTEFWGKSTAFHFTQWTIQGPGIRIRGDPPNQPPPSKDPEHVLNAYPHPKHNTRTCSATSSKECAGSTSLFANCRYRYWSKFLLFCIIH